MRPLAHQQHYLVQPSQRRQHRSVGFEQVTWSHLLFLLSGAIKEIASFISEARVLTCCFAHLWNVIAVAWMSQLLTIHFTQCCEHPGSHLAFVSLHCGFAFWTCCVLFSLKNGHLARSLAGLVRTLTCSVSVQYHLLLCPAREQLGGYIFLQLMSAMNGTSTSVLLVLSFVHRQDHWHPGSDSKKVRRSVRASAARWNSAPEGLCFDRVSECSPSPIWTDVPGLGISQSLVNFDDFFGMFGVPLPCS